MIHFCEGFTKGAIIALFAIGLMMAIAPYAHKYFNEDVQISEVKK